MGDMTISIPSTFSSWSSSVVPGLTFLVVKVNLWSFFPQTTLSVRVVGLGGLSSALLFLVS